MKLVFPAGGELGCSHALDSGDVPLQPSQSAPSISRLFFSSPFPNTLPSPFAPSKVYDPFPLRLRGPASFSCNTIPWWRRGRERGYTRKGARLGWVGGKARGIRAHPALSPRSDPLPRVPPDAVCRSGWWGETLCSSIPVTPACCCSQSACSPGALPLPFRLSSSPPTLLHRSGVGGAPAWSEKGRGERQREERRAAAGGGGAATWYRGRPGAPEPVRARASPKLRRRAAGGGRSCGRRSSAPSGRSEQRAERGWEGAREPAGGRASSVSTSVCRGRVCPKLGQTDRLPGGQTRALALGSGPASARLGACSARLLRPLIATPAPAASTRKGLEVREPLSASRSPRGSAPAAAPRPGAASPIPCSPPGCSEQRCSGAPNSGCRGKCLHEPRGCPGSTTRVLKSVVASNISYLASMSYFG